ncbi:KpsF/GutQ family sugar-phosphate isomerase [Priestia megaterium]|uniref:KpsF/GutQ family sugar-phosphate isomerase n=1 Tax=Priestia TaxID=2800373 RepID=UPI000D516836|nr:KpsF/GutQ family sugar-phosphate isomerase [Priestia megaterium]PVC76042.1 KpsF/GutQ family sugar-phosphate isomerase [Priestia megaterium]
METPLKKINYVNDVKEVLLEEANALIALHNQIDSSINRVIETILLCDGRIIITGVGKSGIIGRKIAATFSSTGTPAFFLHPSEGLHGDLGMVTENDVVLAISNSGETEEVLNIIPSIKRIGSQLIGIVGPLDSSLARKSDLNISIGQVKEVCPLGLAPTTSTTLTLAIGDALAIALLKARGFKQENFAVFHPGGSLGKRLLLTVKDVINENRKNPMVLKSNSISEVIFKMTETGLGAVSIVDDIGQVLGILTDGDLRRSLNKESNIMNSSIINIYNSSPIVIGENRLAVEALRVMEENRINVLPVINENKHPVAMLHIHDLTKLGL